MYKFLLTLFFFPFFLGVAHTAEAHVPVFPKFKAQSDVFVIEDPILSQAFYSNLDHVPNTYKVSMTEPFVLRAEILVPDIETSQNIFSGIIVKLPEGNGRVTEIAQLSAESAGWESEYEPFGGDSYRHGPSFEAEVEAGTYIIEVHTPDNIGKYVLVVGSREEMGIGYFELLGRLIEVKRFFEKTPLLIVASPFVYVPLILALIAFMSFRKYRQKHPRNTQDNAIVE